MYEDKKRTKKETTKRKKENQKKKGTHGGKNKDSMTRKHALPLHSVNFFSQQRNSLSAGSFFLFDLNSSFSR